MSGSTSEGVQALVPDREKEASRSFVLTAVAARVSERGSVGDVNRFTPFCNLSKTQNACAFEVNRSGI